GPPAASSHLESRGGACPHPRGEGAKGAPDAPSSPVRAEQAAREGTAVGAEQVRGRTPRWLLAMVARRVWGAPPGTGTVAVNDRVYTLGEELVIAAPIPVEPDALPCDVVGCASGAAILIPGASLCRSCWGEHLDSGGRYFIPEEHLVGDERWRVA